MNQIDYTQVEEAARELYIRALKLLPDDIKYGFEKLQDMETSERARGILGTMVTNIRVAEDNNNLLCQDTGIPIYNVFIGRKVAVDGWRLKQAIVNGRSEEHTSALQSLMRISYAVFCLKKKKKEKQ